MICKKDVVLWFKELESYKRIDTMCTLLNMCLPFELRFLGTCLEELGRRDSQELRGIELRVNNANDLAADMVACQKGEPTDKKIRRKMALYLALIRACNRTCVTEIFRTLDGWGERDFQAMTDIDSLHELLLVYTMAAHHPVFSFDQHMKCNVIFERIKENKFVSDQVQPEKSPVLPLQEQNESFTLPNLATAHPELLQQQQPQMLHLPGGQHPQLITTPIQMMHPGTIPMNFPHLTKLIPSGDGTMQHQITLDGIPHMISSNISIPTEATNAVLAHPNATWSLRSYPPPTIPSGTTTGGSGNTSMEQPPQAPSPMLSQQSSPSSSRAASPNRGTSSGVNMLTQQQQQQQQSHAIQQQQIRNIPQRITAGGSLKHVRRPSAETTPPPTMVHSQMEMIMPTNLKHMDEVSAVYLTSSL